MQRAFPVKQRIPTLFALYTFLYAVGNNTACQNWLNSVTIHDEWSYATFMIVNDAGIAVDINEFPTTSNPLCVSSAVIATDASHKRD
jgi:hypothetical protein